MSSKVTISSERVLRVNGKPFFPIGARHMPIGGTPRLLEDAGFNCMRWVAGGSDSASLPAQGLPEDLGGMMVYPYVYTLADHSQGSEARRLKLTSLVESVRDHPALLCYEQRNEPAYSEQDHATARSTPEGMIAGSSVIRELDPNHPIRVGHMVCNLVSTLRAYNPAVDILGCNPYVLMGPEQRIFVGCRPDGKFGDSPNQTLSAVGDFTTKMMRVADGHAVWMAIQAMANDDWNGPANTPQSTPTGSDDHMRTPPTRLQLRFMTYNAIIRGATALEFAMYGTRVDEPAWLSVSEVMGELRGLHDVLAAPGWRGTMRIEYEELGFSDWSGVEVLVKLHEGRPWILAANTQFDPMQPIFQDLPDDIGSTLKVVGEDRTVSIADGAFTDHFRPYEVHVYETLA